MWWKILGALVLVAAPAAWGLAMAALFGWLRRRQRRGAEDLTP